MNVATGQGKAGWLLIGMLLTIAACTVVMLNAQYLPMDVSANSGETFGPACGAAILDGNINPGEWSSASRQTFQMTNSGSADPFTATLYVMNSGYYLYLGITINDDEFTTQGQYLPEGDEFRIDFDNDHSGSLFALGDDNVCISAGSPQFQDQHIYSLPKSCRLDVEGGGTSDGTGAASRVGDQNHFELRHPLCSGDSLDFCLSPTHTVGFRLEYLDAEADGGFGSSQFFPGSGNASEASIVIAGECSNLDSFVYLPLVKK